MSFFVWHVIITNEGSIYEVHSLSLHTGEAAYGAVIVLRARREPLQQKADYLQPDLQSTWNGMKVERTVCLYHGLARSSTQ